MPDLPQALIAKIDTLCNARIRQLKSGAIRLKFVGVPRSKEWEDQAHDTVDEVLRLFGFGIKEPSKPIWINPTLMKTILKEVHLDTFNPRLARMKLRAEQLGLPHQNESELLDTTFPLPIETFLFQHNR